MEKIKPLLKFPNLPDDDLEGHRPERGTERVRIVAYSKGAKHPRTNLVVLKTVAEGVWSPVEGGTLRLTGDGRPVGVIVPIEDVREEIAVVAEGATPEIADSIEIVAVDLDPPGGVERRGIGGDEIDARSFHDLIDFRDEIARLFDAGSRDPIAIVHAVEDRIQKFRDLELKFPELEGQILALRERLAIQVATPPANADAPNDGKIAPPPPPKKTGS